MRAMAWAALLAPLLAAGAAAAECPSIVAQIDSVIARTGVKAGDARHEQAILTLIKGITKNENLTPEAKQAAIDHLWKQLPVQARPKLPQARQEPVAAPEQAKPAVSSTARPAQEKPAPADTTLRPPTHTDPAWVESLGLGRKSSGGTAKVIGKGPTAVEISNEAMRVSGLLRVKKPVEACRLRGAELQPGQQVASPQIVAEYAQRMKAGRWDWSRGEKIVVGEDGRGGRVIIEGHHRYMAARLAGIKIPASAFSMTRRPWVASSWDDVVWSASH